MASGSDLDHFAGRPIRPFRIEEGLVDSASFAYNIRFLNEEKNGPPFWEEKWLAFINDPRVSEVTALVIGGDDEQVMDGESCEPQIESLVSGRERLPALKSLFIGCNNPEYDDGEMLLSLPDISPVFLAFPRLEELRLYGWTHGWMNGVRHQGPEFQIGAIHSEVLRSLSIATAALEPRIVYDLWSSHLPALEHVELWLYESEITIDDLAPLFSGQLFPRLRHLALCASEVEDDLAVALAASPLLQRLKVLDLSMGRFTDRGAQALLDCPAVRQLEKLIINYHFCSDEMVQKLRALPIEVEIDEPQDLEDTISGEPEVEQAFM